MESRTFWAGNDDTRHNVKSGTVLLVALGLV